MSKELLDKLQMYEDMGETKIPIILVKSLLQTPSSDEIEEVYMIMSPGGGFLMDFSGNGMCYKDLEFAQLQLKSKNEWSKTKGYGTYQLVTLKILNGGE